jgi:hypothetical protein
MPPRAGGTGFPQEETNKATNTGNQEIESDRAAMNRVRLGPEERRPLDYDGNLISATDNSAFWIQAVTVSAAAAAA